MTIAHLSRAVLTAIAVLAPIFGAGAQSMGGALEILLKGASDTRVSLPYQRPPTDTGDVAGVGASTIRLAGKQWAGDQFTADIGAGRPACYAQFASGPLEGVFYEVVSNSADTLVLDTEGDDLASHPLGQVGFGDKVRIVPYWTIGEVLGNTASDLIITPRASPVFPTDDVLLYNNDQFGINKPPGNTLYFRTGFGWTSVAQPGVSSAGTLLPPGSVFVVRRRTATTVSMVNSGLYHKARRVLYIQGGDGSRGNDTAVALTFPEPVTLDESRLALGVVEASTSPVLRKDEVLLWRDAPSGFNVPPNTTVYYRQGTGWQAVGSASAIGAQFKIQPGEGIIIRKKATSPGADWLQEAPE